MAATAPSITGSRATAKKSNEITSLFEPLFNFQKTYFPETSHQTFSYVSLIRTVSRYYTGCLEFGSGLAGHFWFGISRGYSPLKAGLGVEDLLPKRLIHMAGWYWLLLGGLGYVGFSRGSSKVPMAWQLTSPERMIPETKTGHNAFYDPASGDTHHHLCHILQATRANSDLLWGWMTQVCECGRSGLLGHLGGQLFHSHMAGVF